MSPRARNAALVAGGLAFAVALAASASHAPRAIAQGWLIAFVFWSGVPIGSLVLLMIHRLVGGRWGEAIEPALARAAMLVPLAVLAFIPIAVALSAIFPWAVDAAAAPSGVGRYYLNAPAFIVRAAIALIGWAALAMVMARGRCSRLAAALGLAFHGLAISVVSVDWILSLEPGFSSSAFPATLAVQQILSALGFAAFAAPEPQGDPAMGDLAGLLLASLLGLVYLGFMSYLVAWYGNLPDKADWYASRTSSGWALVIGAAVLVGAVAPFLLLLFSRARASRFVLRGIGALVLIGVWLHVVWLLAPACEAQAFAWSVPALATLIAFSFGAIRGSPLERRPVHAS